MTASLTLTYGALNLTASPYFVPFGSDMGSPANEAVTLAFLLQDGEVELSSRSGNRTIQFDVVIEGASLSALATSEAALIAETERPLNTLTVDPGDGAPATVFEIFRGQVVPLRDDDYELAFKRRYTVTVRALPFPRSAAETVTAALPASGSTTTLVNDGSATTGWSGAVSAGSLSGPSVVSGAVKIGTTAAVAGTVTVTGTLTASITTSSTKYLPVDWKPESGTGAPTLLAFGDGVSLPQMAQISLPSSGLTRTWFYVAASSIAVLRLESTSDVADTGPVVIGTPTAVRSLYVDNINRTDVRPSIGTARQLLRNIDVPGSARAPGALTLEHASNALGDVLIYCYPDVVGAPAYSPPLRQYRVSGGTVTSDSSMVSGATEPITGSTTVFDVPYSAIAEGSHLIVVRTAVTAGVVVSTAVTWTLQTRVNSTNVGPAVTGTGTVPSSATMAITAIGRPQIPLVDVDPGSTTAVLRVSLTASVVGTGIVMPLDEAWLFNTSIGSLIQVACGTGTAASGGPARRVFVTPPSPVRPRPSVRIGHASDGSDSFYPSGSVGAWQFPQFVPPRVKVLTVTTNTTDASLSLQAAARWHTNAAS